MNSNQVFTEVRRIAVRVHLIGVAPVAGAVEVGSVALSLPKRELMRGVLLQVSPDSTERIWIVGEEGGVSEGISIDAGDLFEIPARGRHFFLPVGNLNQIWLVAEVDHALVHYWAI
ncbi:hypothetical protein H6G89_32575 [Oscillatoria sp. FACHB-1407]|uniref:hypothetical protein n=1 Tax=Oscillatoria sp. FACHB-1407 TaxID=2692847 RepID=UPI001686CEFE|nr:hypothetical protein [Oscillatoria sp. FACHB-1407]MBD2465725.1 hypothetical protein [Oscillatoria sp. FACHB-1407]